MIIWALPWVLTRNCRLVLLPDVDVDKYQAIFIYETLFLARKFVSKVWMQAIHPTLQGWKKEINDTLPYRKMIYNHRGRRRNFLVFGIDGWRMVRLALYVPVLRSMGHLGDITQVYLYCVLPII